MNCMTYGMRKEIEKLAAHDTGLHAFLKLQEQQDWTDLEFLYHALLFQTQCLKRTTDAYLDLSLKGPATQYIITTEEQLDTIRSNKLSSVTQPVRQDTANNNDDDTKNKGV